MQRGMPGLAVAVAVALTAWWTLRAGPGTAPGPEPAAAPGPPPSGAELLTVVRLSGTPFERGTAHGRALKGQIRRWLDATLPADPGLRAFALETCGDRLLAAVPDALREELRGVAEGAGVDVREALWLNTRFELAAYGLQQGTPGSDAGEAAVGEGAIVARHFTGRDPGFGPGDLVAFVHDGEPPLVLVGLPGMVGGFLGVRGEAAAAPVPLHGPAQPVLSELSWPLLVRRLLEDPPAPDAVAGLTAGRALSMAWRRPDGVAGVLTVGPGGAAWTAGEGGVAATSEEARALPVAAAPGAGLLVCVRDKDGAWLVEVLSRDVTYSASCPRG